MSDASIRDLRNHGGDLVDRAQGGERITITRNGLPVAELRALPKPGVTAHEMVRRLQRFRGADPAKLRADVDAIVHQSL